MRQSENWIGYITRAKRYNNYSQIYYQPSSDLATQYWGWIEEGVNTDWYGFTLQVKNWLTTFVDTNIMCSLMFLFNYHSVDCKCVTLESLKHSKDVAQLC